MNSARLPEGLRGQFWDTDFDRLDPGVHAGFIAERLMAMTTPEALRWLLANYTAEELLAVCAASRRRPNPEHLAKSPVHFDHAETDPEPRLLSAVQWVTVRRHFEKHLHEFTHLLTEAVGQSLS